MKQERQYPKVMISTKAERSVKNGHPWIYGEEIRKTEGAVQNGGLVDVFAGNAYMGTGFYNSASKITVRLISKNANDTFDSRFWRRRVEYAVAYRKTVMPGPDFACCRLIHGEADQMPGLTVDRYNHILSVQITCVSMGNPHAVVFCEDPDGLDLEKIGPCFEHHEIFPERVNTEFVQILDKNTLKMRVWERGSGETLACGTGACASVVAATLNGYCEKGQDVRVILKGGDLTINYTDERVLMTGGCVKVFEGVIEV